MHQELYNLTKSNYDAQKAVNNVTIQHTVAEVLEGVIPGRVTDIVVEEEEEEEGGRFQLKTAVGTILLKYTVTVNDPLLTPETMRAQLVQAVQEGKMDTILRYNAARFGATGLNSGAFGEPQVTSETTQDDSSEPLNDWEIALIAVGGTLALVLLACVIYGRRKQTQSYRVACVEHEQEMA